MIIVIGSKSKKIIIIVALISIICIVAVSKIIIPEMEKANTYKEAANYVESGKYVDAYTVFISLGDYKDSSQQAKNLIQQHPAIPLNFKNINDTVSFGTYHSQSLNWIILQKSDGKMLLLSEKIIDRKHPYNNSEESVTWENCSLRQWLNSEFEEAAFSDGEQASIIKVHLSNVNNSEYGTSGGNDTEDLVFLLSLDEIETYKYILGKSIGAYGTNYANDLGRFATRYSGLIDRMRAEVELDLYEYSWYLRSPGEDNKKAAYIHNYDILSDGTSVTNEYCGIRPAIWVDLTA